MTQIDNCTTIIIGRSYSGYSYSIKCPLLSIKEDFNPVPEYFFSLWFCFSLCFYVCLCFSFLFFYVFSLFIFLFILVYLIYNFWTNT